MILNSYSIFDIKAQVYSPPFHAITHGAACRIVQDSFTPSSALFRHPNDFIIYCIARFDDATGQLTALDREHVRDVISLMPETPQVADLFANLGDK